MVGEWIENPIHDILEFKMCIFDTKGHYLPFIISKGCGKGCLIPIRLSDLYLPKTTLHIKLAKNHCPTKLNTETEKTDNWEITG